MFICDMVLRWLESGPVTADLTTTVVHRSKLLKKRRYTRSLTHYFNVVLKTLKYQPT